MYAATPEDDHARRGAPSQLQPDPGYGIRAVCPSGSDDLRRRGGPADVPMVLEGDEVRSRTESQVLLKREGHLVKVSWTKRNRAMLDWCYLGDEESVKRIADILSAKGQAAAMELCEMARQYRLAGRPDDERRAPGQARMSASRITRAWISEMFLLPRRQDVSP